MARPEVTLTSCKRVTADGRHIGVACCSGRWLTGRGDVRLPGRRLLLGCAMVDIWMRAANPAEATVRPSRPGRWIAAVLLIAGLVLLVLAVASGFALPRQIRDFQRVPAPGVGGVTFTRPGRYVIYLERPGRCCSFSAGAAAGPIGPWSLDIGLVSARSGQPVPIRNWRGPIEVYAVAGHAGQTAMDFTISQPGSYVLNTRHLKPRWIADVAVGPGILRGMITPVLLFVLGLGALTVAALLFGITLHRRRRRPALPAPIWFPGPVPRPSAWDSPAQSAAPTYVDAPAYVDAPVYADAPAVSSRPARRRTGLTLCAAAVALVGLISLVAAVFAGGAPGRTSPDRPAARSGVAARHPTHPATTPPPVTTAPLTPDQRWLRGLAALKRQMNGALPPGTITPSSLRLTAAILRRCPSQLADLGPPPRLYRQTRDQASRACADFAQAAIWARAAARAYTTTAPTSPAGRKLNKLLNRLDAAVNRGIERIDNAYYGAPVIAP